ncbi:LOW QUALITY PROTEIN: CRIB domain-containing protein RIC6-like [Abrus precatorius]|uniref:LOW QUALITY PROTEIN: CRIB domain-containing protein RIC6-like n=1 Tax=Abrus precatorius TaxID=3816 RepID=A0A8B8M784_ABRPR|nr:LOW QUALITY PROTEIN: CRIB domain-containing protein RIC6-like [Abrus precatorius]
MSGSKVKGLLKGFRYISQIFDNEKEQDIQIGYPTDVKHVAHIGWDGPSVNSPSWMNEFKTSPGFASAPINLTGDVQNKGQDNAVKWVSEDSRRKSSRSVHSQGVGRDLPELPRASRRQPMGDSPAREKTEKTRQSKKSSNKNSQPKDSMETQQFMSPDSSCLGDGSPARSLPDIPKKARRKKSKENSSGGGSSKLRSKAQQLDSNLDSEPESMSKSRMNKGPSKKMNSMNEK